MREVARRGERGEVSGEEERLVVRRRDEGGWRKG